MSRKITNNNGKLLRVAYALITKAIEYNIDRIIEDIKRSNTLKVA